MGGVEGDGFVEQHHGDHVLQTDVGDSAVVHHCGDRGGEAHSHALYLIGVKWSLAADRLDRVEWPLDRRADGPFRDVGYRDFIALTTFLDKAGALRLRCIRLKEVICARENIVHAIPTRSYEQCRGNAASGRHPAKYECLFDVIRVAPPGGNARGLLRGVVECPAHFACVETGGARRGSRGAEGPGDTVCGQTALVAELKAAHGK